MGQPLLYTDRRSLLIGPLSWLWEQLLLYTDRRSLLIGPLHWSTQCCLVLLAHSSHHTIIPMPSVFQWTGTIYKKILVSLSDKIIPNMADPLLMSDWLISLYDHGK